MKAAIINLLALAAVFAILSFQIDRLKERLSKVETSAGLLLAGYKTDREMREFREEKERAKEGEPK